MIKMIHLKRAGVLTLIIWLFAAFGPFAETAKAEAGKMKLIFVYFEGSGAYLNLYNEGGSNYININDLQKFGFDVSTDNTEFKIIGKRFNEIILENTYKAPNFIRETLYPNNTIIDKDGFIILDNPIRYEVIGDTLYLSLRDFALALKANINYYQNNQKDSSGKTVESEEYILINRNIWYSGDGIYKKGGL